MKSGVIPFYRDNKNIIHMYFMVPSDPAYGGIDPQIAKGDVDDGESLREAAMREGKEELGLREKNVLSVIDCGSNSNLKIHVFAAEVANAIKFDKPHFETGKTHWLTMDKFKIRGRKIHLAAVTQAYQKIQNYYKGQF